MWWWAPAAAAAATWPSPLATDGARAIPEAALAVPVPASTAASQDEQLHAVQCSYSGCSPACTARKNAPQP